MFIPQGGGVGGLAGRGEEGCVTQSLRLVAKLPSHKMMRSILEMRSILVPATDFSRDLEERSHKPRGSGSQECSTGIRSCA